MMRHALILVAISSITLIIPTTQYKTWNEIQKQQRKAEKDNFTTSDTLVGKAMDFMYSNKTIMSLIARELWNVGSRAIDKIVELKDWKVMDFMYSNKTIARELWNVGSRAIDKIVELKGPKTLKQKN